MNDDAKNSADTKPEPAPHLFVSTLVGGGKLFAQHAMCCEALRTVCSKHGIGLTIHRNGGTGVDRARNREVAYFRESAATHHLQIDDDVLFEPEDIVKMVRSGLDVTAMVYPRKEIDWKMVSEAVLRGVEPDDLVKFSSSFIYNALATTGAHFDGREMTCTHADGRTEKLGTFMSVRDVGTGCLMVRRSVYERYIERYGSELAYRTDYPPFLATHHRVFGCEITTECEREKAKRAVLDAALNPSATAGDVARAGIAYQRACADDSTLGRYDTEDWSFCTRWRAMGGEVLVFIDGTLTHMGTYAYQGNIRATLNLRERDGREVGATPGFYVPTAEERAAMVTIPRESLWSVIEVASEYDLFRLPSYEAPRILDIGANVGIFALRALARWPGGSVTAYEPNLGSFNLLVQNTVGRNVGGVLAAVTGGVPEGTVTLRRGKHNDLEASLVDIGNQEDGGEEVSNIDASKLGECDVLKVDTEGCEVEILEGYPHLAAVKVLLVEVHRAEDMDKVRALATKAGLTRALPTIGTVLRFRRPDVPEVVVASEAAPAEDADLPPLDAHEIVPGLWMGGYPSSWQGVIRDGFQTLVVTAQERAAAPPLKGVELHAVPFADAAQMETATLDKLIDVAALIGEHVLAGKKVLVTCNEGRNRSGLVVGLAVHAMTGMSGRDIVALIRKQRVKLSNALFANILGKLKALPEKGEPCIVCGARPAPHRYDHGDDGPYCSEHASAPSAAAEVTASAE